MNLNALKMGFANYLQELSETSNKNYNNTSSEASIFMYANEFKSYISDELNVDSSILSKSINDILKMDIVNGKLVDPNEETNSDSFTHNTDETQIVSDEAISDGSQSQNVQTSEFNNPDDMGMMTIQEDKMPEALPEGEDINELSDENLLTDFLNELFQDETIKGILDIDKSGELNDEEIQTFLEAIKGFDGDEENISLEDIISALQAIQDESFSLTPDVDEPEVEDNIPDVQNSQQAQQSSPVSGGNNGGSYGGSVAPLQSSQPQEKTLENMSKDELNAELNKAQSDLSAKQNTLSSLLDGSDSKIQELQANVDDAYDTYQEQLKLVDEDLAKQVDDLKTSIDDKQADIDAKDLEISNQETVVSDAESSYNNSVSTRETLESSLSALESTDTSNMDSDKQADLNSKISELQQKIKEAEAAETKAKETWDKAKEDLEALEEEKETLEEELKDLEEQMTDLEAQIAEQYPQIQQYMDDYNEAKDDLASYKDSSVSTAKADVTQAQNYVNEVNEAINNVDNKDTIKEYCFNDFGEDIIDFASQFIGCNEADGSADKFLKGGKASQIPWCAAFVEYVLENSGNYENIPDWYKNVENKWGCGYIKKAAEAAGAVINGNEAQTGDLVLFKWEPEDTSYTASHIGIIVSIENGIVTTIEGNTSNQVAYRQYKIDDPRLSYCKITE